MSLVAIKMELKDVFSFEAVGKICKNDYVNILFPILEKARKNGEVEFETKLKETEKQL